MKRLFILLILAAAHLVCAAQANPKIEALHAYLKTLGVDHTYSIKNSESGLDRDLWIYQDLYGGKNLPDSLPDDFYKHPFFPQTDGIGTDGMGHITYNGKVVQKQPEDGNTGSDSVTYRDVVSKAYNIIRTKALASHEAYNQIRRTISELQKEATESYRYEYHQNGVDTIIVSMALRPGKIGAIVSYYDRRSEYAPKIFTTPEFLDFQYYGLDDRFKKRPYSAIGHFTFEYRSTEKNSQGVKAKDFDIAGLQKRLAPIFQDKHIRQHTLLCQHDSTFDLGEWNKSLEFAKSMKSMYYSPKSSGKQLYTIYKFTNERQARKALHQVMDCIRQQIGDDPQQIYWMLCDERFFFKHADRVFQAGFSSTSFRDFLAGKRKRPEEIEIMTCMDLDGFYIITNVYHGSYVFPMEWKTLKSIVNGKMTYYKDSL